MVSNAPSQPYSVSSPVPITSLIVPPLKRKSTLWTPSGLEPLASNQTEPWSVALLAGKSTCVSGRTVRTAGSVVASGLVPSLNVASYSFPFSANVVLVRVNVVLVAPGTGENVVPPSVETCHCTVGVGNPLAAASKLASCPANTDTLVGCVVMDGATSDTLTMA